MLKSPANCSNTEDPRYNDSICSKSFYLFKSISCFKESFNAMVWHVRQNLFYSYFITYVLGICLNSLAVAILINIQNICLFKY